LFAWSDGQLLSASLAALIEQTNVPTTPARAGESGNYNPFESACGKLNRQSGSLTLVVIARTELNSAGERGTVIFNFADYREPTGLRDNIVIAQEDIELKGRSGGQHAPEQETGEPKAQRRQQD
jgi:hypothetical protein